MLSLFKSDPIKKLTKQHEIKLEQAFQAQRNGNIRLYSELTFEAEKIEKQIADLKNAS